MRAVLVPGVLALLPEYAGLRDPVGELRAACLAAVAWAAEEGPVRVVGTDQGRRVAGALLAAGGFETGARAPSSTTVGAAGAPSSTTVGRGLDTPSLVPRDGYSTSEVGGALVVVGNGSAKRKDTSPGYVDERAVPFDTDLDARIREGRLGGIDHDLAGDLWADTVALGELADLLPAGCAATVDYDDDPFGVQYWVARWSW